MDILLILAAGKSSRFGGYPKAFCKIDDNYAAQRTVNLGGQFFDRTYLVIHKEIYHSYKNVIQNCKTLAIETGQGDAHSFLRAVRLINEDCEADKITLCWGDTFYLNDTVFRKAAFLPDAVLDDCAGISYSSIDPEPYAWYETDEDMIKASHFRNIEGIVEMGIHDQSIFTFHADIICSQLQEYMTALGLNDDENYIDKDVSKEMKLLDAFTFFYENRDRGLLPMKYMLLDSGVSYSFNTARELEEIRRKTGRAHADANAV